MTVGGEIAAVVDQSATAMAMFDADMRYLAVSGTCLELYGLERAAVIGRIHYDVFPDIPARWRACHQRGLRGEACRSELDLFVRADGISRWHRWSITPWRLPGGRVGGIVISVLDVSRDRELQSSLSAAERLLQSVFDMASVGIAITDTDGRHVRWNAAYQALLGHSEQDLGGMFLGSAIHPDDAPSALAAMEPVLQGADRIHDSRFRLLRADGTETWVEQLICTISPTRGGERRIAVFVRDVSDRMAMEARLRESDRLAAIGMLGAGLGHELGNDLAALRGATSALGTSVGEAAERRPVRESLRLISEATTYLQRLAEGLYLLSSAPSTDAVPKGNPSTCLADWWQQAETLTRRSMPAGVELDVQMDRSTGSAAVEASVLTQIVLNLVINAGQAVARRGDMAPSRGRVGVAAALVDGKVTITVRDNGAGMAPDVARRAFEPFFTTRSGSRGTGLGLAIVQRMVAAYGGTVLLDSVVDVGTTVTITFAQVPGLA